MYRNSSGGPRSSSAVTVSVFIFLYRAQAKQCGRLSFSGFSGSGSRFTRLRICPGKEKNELQDWEEGNAGSSEGILSGSGSDGEYADDFIEMEQEKGAIYEFMSVSVSKLFLFYKDEGWDAVVRELERHTRRGRTSLGRNRGIDYAARLDGKGKELYERLRGLRSEIALKKQLPSYFIFTNRTLYEMCCHMPGTMEEFRALYGVGEKNSREYGQSFLEMILECNGRIMK